MTQTLILFRHEVHDHFYLWNGKYPISIDGGYENHSQPPWSTNVREDLPEKEIALFKKLEKNKQRVFELKGRGRFCIINRVNIETDADWDSR